MPMRGVETTAITLSGAKISLKKEINVRKWSKRLKTGLSDQQMAKLQKVVENATEESIRINEVQIRTIGILVDFGEVKKDSEESDNIIDMILSCENANEINNIKNKVLGGVLNFDTVKTYGSHSNVYKLLK